MNFLTDPKERQKCTIIAVERQPVYGAERVLMIDGGDYLPWDTSDVANRDKYVGVVIDRSEIRHFLAYAGHFKTDLAAGTYYCDDNGNLVNSLPGYSFAHVVGYSDGEYFRFERAVEAIILDVDEAYLKTLLGFAYTNSCCC